MQEERLLVLRMLEDGKITAEEAAELLKALDSAGSEDEEEIESAGFDRTIERVEELAERAGDMGEKFAEVVQNKAHQLAEELEREQEMGGKRLTGWLEKLTQSGLGGLIGLLGGPKYEFEDVIEGQFATSGPITLHLTTFNGRIVIQGCEGSDYSLRLVKTIRSEDEGKAQELAQHLMEVEQRADGLWVKPSQKSMQGCQAALYLTVPRELCYAVELNTYNGRIVMNEFEATDVVAKTANGRIEALKLKAQSMILKTANGRIEVDAACPSVEAHTSNGRITVRPRPGRSDYRLKTYNGSIYALLDVDAKAAYALEASTQNGKIVTGGLAGLVYSVDERKKAGRKRIAARSQNWEEQQEQVRIKAETSNGRIFFGSEEEDE